MGRCCGEKKKERSIVAIKRAAKVRKLVARKGVVRVRNEGKLNNG